MVWKQAITNHSAIFNLDAEKSAVNFSEFGSYFMYGDTNCTA